MSSSEDASRNPDPKDAEGPSGDGKRRPCRSDVDSDAAYVREWGQRFTPEKWAEIVERARAHWEMVKKMGLPPEP
jgi:hypothetical protein